MLTFMTVRELYEMACSGSTMETDQIEYAQLQGWVRTNRNNGSIGFIELNDGTYFRNAQLVYSSDLANFQDVSKYLTGTALTVTGKVVLTPQATTQKAQARSLPSLPVRMATTKRTSSARKQTLQFPVSCRRKRLRWLSVMFTPLARPSVRKTPTQRPMLLNSGWSNRKLRSRIWKMIWI